MSFVRSALLMLGLMLSSAAAHAQQYCTNPTLPPGGGGAEPAPIPQATGDPGVLEVHGPYRRVPCTAGSSCPKGPRCTIVHPSGSDLSDGNGTCVTGIRTMDSIGPSPCVAINMLHAYLSYDYQITHPVESVRFDLQTWNFGATPIGYSIPVVQADVVDGAGRTSTLKLTLERVGTSGYGDYAIRMSGRWYDDAGVARLIDEPPLTLTDPATPIRIAFGRDAVDWRPGMPAIAWSIGAYSYNRLLGADPVTARARVGDLGAPTIPGQDPTLGLDEIYFDD